MPPYSLPMPRIVIALFNTLLYKVGNALQIRCTHFKLTLDMFSFLTILNSEFVVDYVRTWQRN